MLPDERDDDFYRFLTSLQWHAVCRPDGCSEGRETALGPSRYADADWLGPWISYEGRSEAIVSFLTHTSEVGPNRTRLLPSFCLLPLLAPAICRSSGTPS